MHDRPPLTPAELVVFDVLDAVDAHSSAEVSQGEMAQRIIGALVAAGYQIAPAPVVSVRQRAVRFDD